MASHKELIATTEVDESLFASAFLAYRRLLTSWVFMVSTDSSELLGEC